MNKTIIRTALTAILTLLLPAAAIAYDFEAGGIYYNVKDGQAEVTHNGQTKCYSGDIVIPGIVTNGDTTYQVVSIGDKAFKGCTDLSSIVFPDWNGDGRKDFLLSGLCTDGNYLTDEQKGRTSVLCYNLYPRPSRPEPPINPTASVQEDGTVLLQWEVPETVLPNCTYELYITDSLGRQLNSTPAFVGGEHDGIRKVNRMGRVGCVRQWTFHPTTPGIYHWGVQTVNAAYDGSPFTAGPDFTVTSTSGIQSVSASQEASSTDGVQFYSPSGMQLSQPRHGVNIIRSRQGVSKVMRP